jgi:hypothetical protein
MNICIGETQLPSCVRIKGSWVPVRLGRDISHSETKSFLQFRRGIGMHDEMRMNNLVRTLAELHRFHPEPSREVGGLRL